MMQYRSYFIAVLFSLTVFAVGVMLMNWLVDPLDVYRVVRKEGFNSIKSSYIPYARLAKPSQIERGHYQRLAIGSSRMLMGIPIANEAWAAAGGEPGFNASIQGADLRQIHDLFEHAVVNGQVKSVLIDVDLFMFNAWLPSGKYPYPVATFSETEQEHFARERDTALNLLFSPGITLASIETLRKQNPKKDKVMIDGTTNPAKELSQVMEDGYEVRFRQFEDRMVRTGWSPCSDNRYVFAKGSVDAKNVIDKMQVFRDILQIAKKNNVDVKFFISPVHVRLLEMIHAAGLWGDYEIMKRKLVAEIATAYGADAYGVALWDFSGYHTYAQEAVPQQSIPQQQGVAMQWYLDSSHFSQALGHVMLNRMFAAPDTEADVQSSFGVQLRPDNIDAVLQAEREQQAAFQAEHAEMSRDLHQRTAAILQDKKINGTVCQ